MQSLRFGYILGDLAECIFFFVMYKARGIFRIKYYPQPTLIGVAIRLLVGWRGIRLSEMIILLRV